jgi:SAM-dependent methyltransferase
VDVAIGGGVMTVLAASFTEVYSSALRGEACRIVGLGAAPRPLPVSVWTRVVDAGDRAVLATCEGPTLDIGCGPGRMTQYLAELGHAVLGIDVVPEAVFQTRDRGASALLRDVFGPVPGEGRWQTALLADGNIGIGGDPVTLLRRTAELLRPGGRIVVDLAAPGTASETVLIRLETGSHQSRPFPWAVVGADGIDLIAARADLMVAHVRRHDDRWFAVLQKAR